MRKSLLCLSLLLAVSLSACGKSKTPETNQGTGGTAGGGGTATVDAAAIYKQNCTSCHGVNLEGGGAPKLQNVGAKYSKDQIAGIVSNGKGAMPSFKGRLSDADINGLADWLAAKK
ncbi:cytochrome c [Paenibacillus hemerocallicola]|uniref:Cytochrome c n=1 Tax=Paenibacillus hemerocallicola TaxID=1172614 RepID=A0A5C4T994_9BACL|nr:cytochrome c [Paenibacillus hemerocallicola]TNJ65648.1 cytochrome c [Paenibacillus hemerocallicola]